MSIGNAIFLILKYTFLIFCSLAFFLVCISNFKKGNPCLRKHIISCLITISIIASTSYISMKAFWGTDTIGSFFSKYEYDTKYYVQLFPENSESKNYYVPAELHVKENRLSIKRAYWPEKGYTTFYKNGNDDSYDFYSTKITSLTDDKGKRWYVILSDEKAK